MTTVIYEQRRPYELQATARETEDALWISASDLLAATGWQLKPQGLCRDDACLASLGIDVIDSEGGYVDLVAFARRENRGVLHDREHGVWAFAAAAPTGSGSAEAPDFTFADIDGAEHSLSDYRGQKVFLYTWGSYCGCSFDPPVWETVYQELREKNFQMISIALDTAGSAAVEDRIRPHALSERPEEIRRLRGWSEQRWNDKSIPSHPCLIDEDHELAVSYGMSNVPMAVWIDEQGRMARPPEPAGVSDHFRSMDPDSFVLPDDDANALVDNRERYIAALKDWVTNGADSQYALGPEEVAERLQQPTAAEVDGGLHVRIARWLYQGGDLDGAKQHLDAAVSLCPDKWNYRRQAMVLDPALVGALNVQPGYWAAMSALGDDAFYPDIDLPGMTGTDNWQAGLHQNVPA